MRKTNDQSVQYFPLHLKDYCLYLFYNIQSIFEMGNLCGCGETQKTALQEKIEKIKVSGYQPFFANQILTDRMTLIRTKFIEPIRINYNVELFKKNIQFFKSKLEADSTLLNLVNFRYWNDEVTQDQYAMIKMTTHIQGHKCITSLINSTLRNSQIEDERIFQLSVFLIEAINIQLYLLTKQNKMLRNYQGTVYRGLTVAINDYNQFMKIMSQQFEKRYISVPLSLWSSSKKFPIAFSFCKSKKELNPEKEVNIIFKINVISLLKEDLDLYHQLYPSSTVSTICAVDISHQGLTFFPNEHQVLLRGAFLQILQLKQLQSQMLGPFTVIECVMVNANRDHISTSFLGERADTARQMFASINKNARNSFAYKHQQRRKYGRSFDSETRQYQKEIEDYKISYERLQK